MTTARNPCPGTIAAGLLVLGLLAACGLAPIPNRPTFVESADVLAGIARAERECGQLMAAMASARAAGAHADVPRLYGDLHFHMALVDDALVQVEALSAMALSSGWARLAERDRHAPQDAERSGTVLDREPASDARRSCVHALAASSTRLISAAASFKGLEAQAVSMLDVDFSPHGLASIRPLLGMIMADVPQVLRSLADLAERTIALRHAITGNDHGRIRPAERSGSRSAAAASPRTAAPGVAS